MILVTKTFMPPQHEYISILNRAWDHHWLTNRGVLVRELEDILRLKLNVSNIIATTNGTLPLQIAIKALGLTGEIITTPFSYVATTSSIVWEGCTPVFVDIHPQYLTIDETKIEAAITAKTTAILATHVFGNPCAVEEIETIAKKHDLKVIYDAAHAFGVTYKGKSIFNYGDISTCSFHATKLFHTGEGGAVFTDDEVLLNKLFYHHNFGHEGPHNFQGVGINAKMSELQAAMGLAVLPYMDEIIKARREIIDMYNQAFDETDLQLLKVRTGGEWNFCYYPIIFRDEELLMEVDEKLRENEIYARRYFYPSLNNLSYVKYVSMPISDSIAKRVLCLPLYHGLAHQDVERIISVIIKEL